MALETRQRGSIYYYRARKVCGRVVKEYVGAGQAAVLASRIDAQLGGQTRAEAEERRSALETFDADEAPLADLCRKVELLARGALLGAGYRQHDRGQWRRRREQNSDDG